MEDGLPLFDNLSAIRFISYSGTNYSELFGCNRIIRNCSAAIVQIHYSIDAVSEAIIHDILTLSVVSLAY